MALLPRLRRLLRRPVSASKVGVRRPTSARRRDTIHEDSVRALLHEDPNDARAFQALAEIVRRRAAEMVPDGDPLTAPQDDVEKQRAADLAVWALGEEIAGNPRAWYPLIELARLSVHDDHDAALRRLATAAERDPSGQALAEGLAVLREAGLPVEALGLGVGHWRVKEQTPEIARHLVHAAIEADRPLEAKHHLAALEMHPDKHAVARLRPELEQAVAAAEQHIAGT
ncbi:hypothetical protein [Cellulomonas carbonis]|uniref:Tetratricopeptide repeat protein n=1 Tax=Cellulomonas carbonis T26 TaxID=947969 RepID=A0A0A0BQU4_9CELL|nr:hypothetical protein [Cellulomonas carbonis]KGM10838.1 hypothetical protein N868_13200 [Cellulomonas carbonis T26]MDT0164229.1 hypothetical protein [Actinotalea sp. AC32]